jgi:cytochrome c553
MTDRISCRHPFGEQAFKPTLAAFRRSTAAGSGPDPSRTIGSDRRARNAFRGPSSQLFTMLCCVCHGTSSGPGRIPRMDGTEQERLEGRLARLKRLLLQTTDPAVATIISDDIAEVESRIRAARSPTDLQAKGAARRFE